jgi:hypothetical protein
MRHGVSATQASLFEQPLPYKLTMNVVVHVTKFVIIVVVHVPRHRRMMVTPQRSAWDGIYTGVVPPGSLAKKGRTW